MLKHNEFLTFKCRYPLFAYVHIKSFTYAFILCPVFSEIKIIPQRLIGYLSLVCHAAVKYDLRVTSCSGIRLGNRAVM